MDAIDQLGELAKGEQRGGKYYRRTSTGNVKHPWRYFYTKEAYEKHHIERAAEADAKHGGQANRAAEEQARAEGFRSAAHRNEVFANVPPAGRRGFNDAYHGVPVMRSEVAALGKRINASVPKAERMTNLAMGHKHLSATSNAREARHLSNWGLGNTRTMTPDMRMEPTDDYSKHLAAARTKGKTEKSMQPTMSKGLMSFQAPYGEGKKLDAVPTEWLPDYVDAFLEEAYEHERTEAAHRDPNLITPGTDPADALVGAIYNEFVAYCAQNSNLARAKKSIPVTKEYVASRLNEMGHVHVNTENHNAETRGAVAGYYPTRMALSQDGHAAAEQERDDLLRHMGALVKSEDSVPLRDDGDNPMDALAGAMEHHAQSYHGKYGAQSPVGTHDADCLFHGRDLHKSGPELAVHGIVCSCK